jgi:hypothetical protein
MIVIDWRGVREDNPERPVVPCTKDNLDRFFRKLHWAAVQMDNNAGSRGRFFPKSAADSSTSSANVSEEI